MIAQQYLQSVILVTALLGGINQMLYVVYSISNFAATYLQNLCIIKISRPKVRT